MSSSPTPSQLRKIRVEHGFTQEQLARLLYVTRATVNNWETGRARMSPGHWELLHYKLNRKFTIQV